MKKKVATIATAAILSSTFSATGHAAYTHTVQKGDTLTHIAKKYNTTVSLLKKWNQLPSDRIFLSQTLMVASPEAENAVQAPTPVVASVSSAPQPTSSTYTVVAGDTLSVIAKQHGMSLADLRSWNSIEGHLIYPGQVLNVSQSSNGSSISTTPQPSAPIVTENAGKAEYVIKSGDTLSKIALRVGLSVNELKNYNNLKSDIIFPGQKLRLKGQAGSGSTSVSKPKPIPAEKNGSIVPVPSPVSDSDAPVTMASVANGAIQLAGTPYQWGGVTPDGFDCSGFIYYVYNQAGKSMSRQSSEGYYERSFYVNSPQVGDLVFFENTYKPGISHVGVYLGNNQFIHAGPDGVEVTSLDNSYYKKHFDSFKRFY